MMMQALGIARSTKLPRLAALIVAVAGLSVAGGSSLAFAQAKLKVAAVYTVPVEQQ